MIIRQSDKITCQQVKRLLFRQQLHTEKKLDLFCLIYRSDYASSSCPINYNISKRVAILKSSSFFFVHSHDNVSVSFDTSFWLIIIIWTMRYILNRNIYLLACLSYWKFRFSCLSAARGHEWINCYRDNTVMRWQGIW